MLGARSRDTGSASPRRCKPVFRSAPSFSSSFDEYGFLGTRSEVLACIRVQRWVRSRARKYNPMLMHLLRSRPALPLSVCVTKSCSTSRIGVSFREDSRCRAIVHHVSEGSPAASAHMSAYDELLSVNGEAIRSAMHAARLIRDAPAGPVHLLTLSPPGTAVRAATILQTALRRAIAGRQGAVRRVLVKPEPHSVLGITLAAEWHHHALISAVREGGLAYGVLHSGDLLLSINGVACDCGPADAAKRLRDATERISVLLVPSSSVDPSALRLREQHEMREHASRAIALSSSGGDGPDGHATPSDECAVCFSLLCEPVCWPASADSAGAGASCSHLFCKPCVRQWATHAFGEGHKPCCPLCRAPADVSTDFVAGILVDEAAAALVEERHPQEYAESLAMHRELSMEWRQRERQRRAGASTHTQVSW